MPLLPLPPLDEAISDLSLDALLDRMDLVLHTALRERGEEPAPGCEFPSVRSAVETPMVARHEEQQRRSVAHAAFRFLAQRELSRVTHVAMNKMYFGVPCGADELEHSPVLRICHASLSQSSIILCRISFECFVELLHLAREGRLSRKNRKFKYMKSWLFTPENPFCFFSRQVVGAHIYDRAHRSPEVHATSHLIGELVHLRPIDAGIENQRLGLYSLVESLWDPFLEILHGRKPCTIHGVRGLGDDLADFQRAYLDDDPTALREMLESLRERLRDQAD